MCPGFTGYNAGMKKHLLALLLLAPLALALSPAHASMGMGNEGIDPGGDQGSSDQDQDAPKVQQPPSPTPGSKVSESPVIPAGKDAAGMNPTDMLFDAITRGDLGAARVAVARGADLNARNALGEKPVDSAVDLGRNDITFMLAVQRPLVEYGPAPAAATPDQSAAPTPVRRAAAHTQAAPNRGTPQPAAGFLGF